MPGYMMHLCEGNYILDKLRHGGKLLSDDDANAFLLGCVLPDAVDDKELTHFRPSWQSCRITKYPDLDYVLSRYPTELMTPADIGIIAHLALDSHYVTDFWHDFFSFEDDCGRPTTITADIARVRLSGGSLVPLDVFFSRDYFYGDYDATNGLFIRDFRPVIPDVTDVAITIAECRAFSASALSHDLRCFASYDALSSSEQTDTHVFTYEAMRDFVTAEAERFLSGK